MKSKRLVVIPVFNEEKALASVLKELRLHYEDDILAIDDGSRDKSGTILRDAQSDSKLHVITHERNMGYGTSLIQGFGHAEEKGYEVLVTMDCDFQHEPKQVPQFFDDIGRYDVLSGSRYLLETNGNDPPPPERKRINQIITERINRETSYCITDAFCGFKAYRVAALAKLSLDEAGYAFPLQFWIQAYCADLTIKEIPVARIYADPKRSFGRELDDPELRLKYYERVIDRELSKCREEKILRPLS